MADIYPIEVPVINNVSKGNKIKQKRIAPKQRALLKALEANMGNVTDACEKVGIARKTHYQWYKTNELYKDEVDTIPERIKDFAESSLLLQIKDKIPSSTIFFLKTRARDRGYIEESTVNNNFKGEGFKLIIEDGSKMETK